MAFNTVYLNINIAQCAMHVHCNVNRLWMTELSSCAAFPQLFCLQTVVPKFIGII